MLARDFIDDSLYNPNYGYFPTQAEIFDPDSLHSEDVASVESGQRGFDFGSLRRGSDFADELARRYGESEAGARRQVWHTPTELFKPWYARAIARFLSSEYRLSLYPYADLTIVEIGAGNGTLMRGILDYLAQQDPEVYDRTRYRIVEISPRLAAQQKRQIGPEHATKVQIHQSSIFDWQETVTEPCFIVALEVLDNLAHDVVRYTLETHQPLQCVVAVDQTGDFHELYEPVSDPDLKRFLALRQATPTSSRSPALNRFLSASPALRKLRASMPFAPNLTLPEFAPTRAVALLDVLREKFPLHRLLMSDFDALTDTVPGFNAPVVQTRYDGQSVACSTYLVSQGFFDIFFPTNFKLLKELYALVMQDHRTDPTAGASNDFFSPTRRRALSPAGGLFSGFASQKLKIYGHAEFLTRYGELEKTQLKDGSNPMLEYYQNTKFIC
ncbi:uncharacterized protein L969DRAFT_25194 [Mixia osmundae IAM 14324]|uniref:Protein arginine methyltransferase NDUFAF7 n=1 Tax=Mixia osmundae (strain CBS 9802 / IAM 14324 / JCM 22182 / KY 12970) TaxID=764103 RepID=G7DSI5_MIXOS|nr:uncharacterized protein L969DRAFT_25194 [Mixia osmundae IAM 14324]KEI37957.1 hypothetical protein L969DRAFT_25194 [Mixia osmundae IAM 14324]GAA93545.1 hypothetical protein E5Q_00189 [Mixia osmundae IAM 14324]